MDLRIFTEPQQGASYDDLLRVAKAAEAAGYDAFFRSDHFLKMGSADGLPGPTVRITIPRKLSLIGFHDRHGDFVPVQDGKIVRFKH